MKLSLWQLGVAMLLLSFMISLGLVLLSPDRFIEASVDGDYFVAETVTSLDLESKLYLLEPNVRLQQRINDLDYIERYSIERFLPNRLHITFEARLPLACSLTTIYFSVSRFAITSEVSTLCQNAVLILGGNPDVVLSSLEALDPSLRNLIERIEYQEDEALVTLRSGQQVVVYPSDLQPLQQVVSFEPQSDVIDLRRNYA